MQFTVPNNGRAASEFRDARRNSASYEEAEALPQASTARVKSSALGLASDRL